MQHYHKDHCNDASLTVKNQARVRRSKNDEFLNDDGKSAADDDETAASSRLF